MTAEIAREHLNIWLEAEKAVASSQSYTIGTRTLTRANLNAIRDTIKFWENQLESAEEGTKRGRRNRVYRVVPRDL